MRISAKSVLLSAAAASVVAGSSAVPAAASTGDSGVAVAPGVTFYPAGSKEALSASCDADKVCMWQLPNFGGYMYKVYGRGLCNKYVPSNSSAANMVQSVVTGRDRPLVAVYMDRNCEQVNSGSLRQGVSVADWGRHWYRSAL